MKAFKVNRLVAVLIMVIVLFPLLSSCLYELTVFEDGSGRDWHGRYYTPERVEHAIRGSCVFQPCISFENERAEQNFWARVYRRMEQMCPLERERYEEDLRRLFVSIPLPPGAGGAIDDLPSTTTVGGHSGGGKGGGGK